jgi:hypothetical protein
MEPLQKEVSILSQKLEVLYQVIQQLDGKVSQALSLPYEKANQVGENLLIHSEIVSYQSRRRTSVIQDLEHKDVIADDVYSDCNFPGTEKQLTPEIQIQRLTAQLTAAYNRIAALEEQLLSKRMNSSV